jgi:hypothetical protein
MILVVPVDIITFEGRPNNITIGLETEAVKLCSAGCAEVSMVLEETLIEDGSSHASSCVRGNSTMAALFVSLVEFRERCLRSVSRLVD